MPAKRKTQDTTTHANTDTTAPAAKKNKKAMVKELAVVPAKAPSSTQQKGLVAEFIGVTAADKTTAGKVLKQHNWNLSAAINAFFNQPVASNTSSNRAAVTKIFDKYRDNPKEAPDEINLEGTGTLLGDLKIDITDVGALVLFELVQSPSLGVITRQGCVDGLAAANADSLPKISAIVEQRRSQLPSGGDAFRAVYNHTFALGLQERQKSLAMEMALEFWKLLFSTPAFDWRTDSTPWREWWLEFYEAKIKKAVNKDLWKQTLVFALETVKDDSMSFWSEESSWPSVIDEFVAWVKEKRGKSAEAMDTN